MTSQTTSRGKAMTSTNTTRKPLTGDQVAIRVICFGAAGILIAAFIGIALGLM